MANLECQYCHKPVAGNTAECPNCGASFSIWPPVQSQAVPAAAQAPQQNAWGGAPQTPPQQNAWPGAPNVPPGSPNSPQMPDPNAIPGLLAKRGFDWRIAAGVIGAVAVLWGVSTMMNGMHGGSTPSQPSGPNAPANPNNPNAPTDPNAPANATPVDAGALSAAYGQNQAQQYDGKAITVSGTIVNAAQAPDGRYVVELYAPQAQGQLPVAAVFAQSYQSQLAAMNFGQPMTVQGVCNANNQVIAIAVTALIPSTTTQGNAPQGNAPQGGQPYNAPQGGQPYNSPQGGQPYNAPQGGQPYNAPQGQQPYNAPQGGQPYTAPQGGQPYTAPQGSQPYDTPQGTQPDNNPDSNPNDSPNNSLSGKKNARLSFGHDLKFQLPAEKK